MSLELKLDNLRVRGELTGEERDRLLALLQGAPATRTGKRINFFTPLRTFLLGIATGVGIAYLTWGLLMS